MERVQPSEALAREAGQGNMAAFASLVERHKERVYRTLWQMVGNDSDAQDLSQEVFLKLYRHLGSYRGDSAFTTWLHRLTVNLALDWLRARQRRPLQVPLDPQGGDEDTGALIRSLPADEPTPEELTLRRERRQRLLAAVQGLPPDYREAVVLHHFHNLSYKEISERTGSPVKTIETRLYRARALLRRQLESEEGGAGGDMQASAAATGKLLRPGVSVL